MAIRQSDRDDIYGVKRNSRLQSILDGDDLPQAGIKHSHGYHSYFEGWTEVKQVKENGRFKIKRIYTSAWIVRDLSTAKCVMVRLLYLITYLCGAGFYLWALNLPTGSNFSAYVALPGLISIVFLFLAAVHVIAYLFAEKRWTIHTYRVCHENFQLAMLTSSACMCLTGVMSAIYLILDRSKTNTVGIMAISSIFVGAACLGGLFLLEHRASYKQMENDTKLPEGVPHEIW